MLKQTKNVSRIFYVPGNVATNKHIRFERCLSNDWVNRNPSASSHAQHIRSVVRHRMNSKMKCVRWIQLCYSPCRTVIMRTHTQHRATITKRSTNKAMRVIFAVWPEKPKMQSQDITQLAMISVSKREIEISGITQYSIHLILSVAHFIVRVWAFFRGEKPFTRAKRVEQLHIRSKFSFIRSLVRCVDITIIKFEHRTRFSSPCQPPAGLEGNVYMCAAA